MKLRYDKTYADKEREDNDIKRNPIMRFLKHQDHFKFNIGDVLIKQIKWYSDDEWKTEVITGVNTAKKFMYVFENELGIGYVKQLRVDGSGFTSTLVCTANFNPDNTRFVLDPDFVDHMLIGDDDFQYNKEYMSKKAFREDAIKKNSKILIRTRSVRARAKWLASLKVGDMFWMGDYFDDLPTNRYRVTVPITDKEPLTITIQVIEHRDPNYVGKTYTWEEEFFMTRYITDQQPFPMKDPLCDRPRS